MDEEQQYRIWVNETTNQYRGKFISKAISVEMIIEEFLAWYFCENNENKRIHFHQLIMGSIDVTFSQKIKMFTEIVLKFIDKELSTEFQNYITKIEKLRQKRNDFAHTKVDSSPQSIEKNKLVRDKLNLIKIKDYQIQEIILDIQILDKQLNEFDDLIIELSKLSNRYTESKKALPS